MNCGHGIDIDREDWEGGYGLFRLDTTPAGSGHPDHLIPHRSGNVNLYLKFGTPKPEVLNLIVYAEFQNHLEIWRLVIDAWYTTCLKVLEDAYDSRIVASLNARSCPSTYGEQVWRSVRALASHQCGPGSIPGLGVICGLSLLVLYSAPRGFSPGTPVFPSPQKPKFDLI